MDPAPATVKPCGEVATDRRTKNMLEDDDLPRPKPARLVKPVLEMWGVAELEGYIGELRAEIARAEADILRKQSHRSAADAFFRKP
jgi:uncharacterized small protein (DUF1192 family)